MGAFADRSFAFEAPSGVLQILIVQSSHPSLLAHVEIGGNQRIARAVGCRLQVVESTQIQIHTSRTRKRPRLIGRGRSVFRF